MISPPMRSIENFNPQSALKPAEERCRSSALSRWDWERWRPAAKSVSRRGLFKRAGRMPALPAKRSLLSFRRTDRFGCTFGFASTGEIKNCDQDDKRNQRQKIGGDLTGFQLGEEGIIS